MTPWNVMEYSARRPVRWMGRGLVALVVLLAALPAVAAPAPHVQVSVSQDSGDRIVLDYTLGEHLVIPAPIEGDKWVHLSLPGEPLTLVAGEPALPRVCRSIVIPDDAKMEVRVLAADFEDVSDVAVAPSKGNLLRTVNPADVPYEFGPVYTQDAFYPGPLATLREPYILRDLRAVTVELNPFQYNPVTRTLRVYRSVSLEVVRTGADTVNVPDRSLRSARPSRAFESVYRSRFVNYASGLRYAPMDEEGDMLIICHDAWLSNVQPLATHKTARGINTTVVGVSTIGNNSTSIKNYIQNAYNTSNLAFVLLVGDAAQVATPSSGGGAADPTYAKVAGGDDYPDIIMGRFSAETAAQVDTQVQRTITYETLPAPLQDWFWRGTGIASAEGTGDDGETDIQHMNNIRTPLLAFGYTLVDQIYDPGASATMVSNALNAGRGIVNYCGHGSTTSWSTTGFSNSNVAALTNDNMLPFIFSVACVNGNFSSSTCFGEAWLRSTHNGQPIGAIAAYMSSINQTWSPPMEAQDEFNILLTNEAYVTYGAMCYAGSCSMMDDYGSGGVSMFDTWHIFGDPSLRIAVTCSDAGEVTLDRGKYACDDTLAVAVVDCGLNLNDLVEDTVTVVVTSDSEPAGEAVLLTEVGPASGQFEGSLPVGTTAGAGVLLVAPGDTLTVTYVDADNGQGGTNIVLTGTAVVDCTPPVVSNVQTAQIQPRSAVVTFSADEPVRGTVQYGTACAALTQTAIGTVYDLNPAVAVSGLQSGTTYFFAVEATDEAGNSASDDNGGECYSFTTPEIPDFFTELFASDNDLDNLTLTFTINGSSDFYAGCVESITELPVDPAGGTVLTLSDDSYSTVNLTGGAQVSLYGVSYSTFYPASNGYVTFTAGDNARNESLADHFDLPRISALFDDLNPSSAGSVSWKQLADRVVVTWLNVPEYNTSNSNTFQIEMRFDGTIVISYLSIAASDGLAGLSKGNGVDPDYYPSDLSGLGACGPKPPVAQSASYETEMGQEFEIVLSAIDDGLPDPPAALSHVITELPTRGGLFDPGTGEAIGAVPYTLVNGGVTVLYRPSWGTSGQDSFRFKANDGGEAPEGGDSNEATVSIMINAAPPGPVYTWPLDVNPGWSVEGQWAFGAPKGGGTHNRDPGSAHTGQYVYGYNLYGDYANNLPLRCLTTQAIDCSRVSQAQLRFWRWLGVEAFDSATVQVSADGQNWSTVWSNQTEGLVIVDVAWTPITLDLSAVADGSPTVFVRWGMGPTDDYTTYPGWNIDDVEIWGVLSPAFGDFDGDGEVDLEDFARMPDCLTGPDLGPVIIGCEAFDFDIDTDVDLSDFASFQEAMSQ